MSKNNLVEFAGRGSIRDELPVLIRESVCSLIAQALKLASSESLSLLSGWRVEMDRAAEIRNGCLPGRTSQTAIGPVGLKSLKIRCHYCKLEGIRSGIVAPIVRKIVILGPSLP